MKIHSDSGLKIKTQEKTSKHADSGLKTADYNTQIHK